MGSSEDAAGFYPVLAYFRENNAEGLRIRERLDHALSLSRSDDHSAALHAFKEAQHVILKAIEAAECRAESIDGQLRADPETNAWYARELVQVSNGWDDLDRLWAHAGAGDAPLLGFVMRGKDSIAILDALVFTCACQTIPDELDNYLKNYRIGTCLDFVATFQDQLPDEASTRAVLANLAPQSGIVSGLIDLRNAKVIKADQRSWRQAMSVVAVVAAAGMGFALIAFAVHMATLFDIKDAQWKFKPDQWRLLNGAYLLFLLGVVGHWVLDRIKQSRAAADVTPFSEWLMWIHVNEVPIVVRIATVWLLVTLGIGLGTFDLSKGLQAITFFTAGYFMDSTFDALIGRFNTFIGDYDPDKKAKENQS